MVSGTFGALLAGVKNQDVSNFHVFSKKGHTGARRGLNTRSTLFLFSPLTATWLGVDLLDGFSLTIERSWRYRDPVSLGFHRFSMISMDSLRNQPYLIHS